MWIKYSQVRFDSVREKLTEAFQSNTTRASVSHEATPTMLKRPPRQKRAVPKQSSQKTSNSTAFTFAGSFYLDNW
jgi:hypothetical protein